tara:strand:+ start:1832 stop:2098 length:267 start_codon:yes stop_codon:yes gene_type:complete
MMEKIIMTTFSIEQLRDELTEPIKGLLTEKKVESEELLTRKQAAKFLNVTLVTLDDWTKRAFIEGGRIGTRVYYKKSNLIKAVDNDRK